MVVHKTPKQNRRAWSQAHANMTVPPSVKDDSASLREDHTKVSFLHTAPQTHSSLASREASQPSVKFQQRQPTTPRTQSSRHPKVSSKSHSEKKSCSPPFLIPMPLSSVFPYPMQEATSYLKQTLPNYRLHSYNQMACYSKLQRRNSQLRTDNAPRPPHSAQSATSPIAPPK